MGFIFVARGIQNGGKWHPNCEPKCDMEGHSASKELWDPLCIDFEFIQAYALYNKFDAHLLEQLEDTIKANNLREKMVGHFEVVLLSMATRINELLITLSSNPSIELRNTLFEIFVIINLYQALIQDYYIRTEMVKPTWKTSNPALKTSNPQIDAMPRGKHEEK